MSFLQLVQREMQGSLPRLVVASLPNNRTLGTALGAASPRAMVCENDVAIGRIVNALARSKFWNQMLILIVPGGATTTTVPLPLRAVNGVTSVSTCPWLLAALPLSCV